MENNREVSDKEILQKHYFWYSWVWKPPFPRHTHANKKWASSQANEENIQQASFQTLCHQNCLWYGEGISETVLMINTIKIPFEGPVQG